MNSYLKRIAAFVFMISFVASSFLAAPVRAEGAVVLQAILEVIIPPLIIVDALSCSLNGFFGCDGGNNNNNGSGGGTTATVAATPCTTGGNICGMTNSGDLLENGQCADSNGNVIGPPADSECPSCTSNTNVCGMTNTGYIVNGECNVTTPSNTLCPPPDLNNNGGGGGNSTTTGTGPFYAKPTLIDQGGSTTIFWNVHNATDCDISGNTVETGPVSPIGQINSGIINATTIFSITCENGSASSTGGGGPKATGTLKITIFPKFQEF